PGGPEAIQRFRSAIERAGGVNVWVKKHSTLSRNAVNVLLVPSAYNAIEQAIARAAQDRDLRMTQTILATDHGGMRSMQVTAYFRRDAVCRWQMREVPRILRVAIIIDDLGQNMSAARDLLSLRSPLTFSVMPRLPFSRETAEAAHQAGIEVMLHLPMQPFADSAPDVSPHEIKVGMGGREVSGIIATDIASVPYVAGVNNHMGSRATSDPRLMNEVMAALAARHLFYIDSRTAASSVALEVARRAGVPSFYRSVFLDDTRTVPYTLGQLRRLSRVAEDRGVALAIGHPYPSTIAALRQFLPNLERDDIQLVRVSALLNQKAAARLSPPLPGRKLRASILPHQDSPGAAQRGARLRSMVK
ncbi:MAG: divergent polysaccharide deacetylase family protein, partial [Terriglobia bacterium]